MEQPFKIPKKPEKYRLISAEKYQDWKVQQLIRKDWHDMLEMSTDELLIDDWMNKAREVVRLKRKIIMAAWSVGHWLWNYTRWRPLLVNIPLLEKGEKLFRGESHWAYKWGKGNVHEGGYFNAQAALYSYIMGLLWRAPDNIYAGAYVDVCAVKLARIYKDCIPYEEEKTVTDD